MKKTLFALAAIVGVGVSAYSQGVVVVGNSFINSDVVDYNAANTVLTGSANYTPASSFTAQLWYTAATTQPTPSSLGADQYGYLSLSQFNTAASGLTLADTLTGSGGSFEDPNGVLLSGTTGGAAATLVLVAWTGSYANLAAAVSGGADVGIITFSNPTAIGTSDPNFYYLTGWDALTPSPAAAAYNSTTFGGSDLVLSPVPEPTSLALAGLGGFGMLMALRRKQA
jgi:hypothetical protein